MDNREDAVSSMVYEATARLRDPVYGSVGIISSLQKHIFHLQSELNEVSAEALSLKTQLSDASTSSFLEDSQKQIEQNAYANSESNDLQLLLPEAADYCFQETDQFLLPQPY